MIELILIYAFTTFVVFSVTGDKKTTLLWPVTVVKSFIGIIASIVNSFREIGKK